ncbi:MAG: hypothetical protein JST30_02105 [Armatimonadetes bacterium]|nr:hypothetical protein [Armatimonadota bacterium]
MKRDSFAANPRTVLAMRKAMIGSLLVIGVLVSASALHLVQTRNRVAQATAQATNLDKTLNDLRLEVSHRPAEPSEPADATRGVLTGLQSSIEKSARTAGCTINEFQATPERTPYLSAFSLETDRKDWEQVNVRLSLFGPLSSALTTVEGLRRSGVPIEPDSIEIARQSVSETGVTSVALRLAFRILVKAGNPS